MDKPGRWLIAGVVIGCVIAGAMLATDIRNKKSPAEIAAEKKAARASDANSLIAEYQRSRLATYRANQTFTRSRGSVVVLQTSGSVAQQPPKRITKSETNVEFVNDDEITNCSYSGDVWSCGTGPYDGWNAQVDGAAKALHDYFFAEAPLYEAVKLPGNCWRMNNVYPEYPSPPFGDQATFCFDAQTHMPTRRELNRGNVHDLLLYQYTGQPTPADFVVPKDGSHE